MPQPKQPSLQRLAEDHLRALWRAEVSAGRMKRSEAAMSSADAPRIAKNLIQKMRRSGATAEMIRNELQTPAEAS